MLKQYKIIENVQRLKKNITSQVNRLINEVLRIYTNGPRLVETLNAKKNLSQSRPVITAMLKGVSMSSIKDGYLIKGTKDNCRLFTTSGLVRAIVGLL